MATRNDAIRLFYFIKNCYVGQSKCVFEESEVMYAHHGRGAHVVLLVWNGIKLFDSRRTAMF